MRYVCVCCVWLLVERTLCVVIDKYLLEAATTAREPIKLGKIGFESTDRAVPYGVCHAICRLMDGPHIN